MTGGLDRPERTREGSKPSVTTTRTIPMPILLRPRFRSTHNLSVTMKPSCGKQLRRQRVQKESRHLVSALQSYELASDERWCTSQNRPATYNNIGTRRYNNRSTSFFVQKKAPRRKLHACCTARVFEGELDGPGRSQNPLH